MRRSSLYRVVACSAFVLKFFVIVIIMGRKTRANTDEDINEADLSEEGRLIVLLPEQKIEKIVSKFTSEVKDRDAKIDHLKTEVDLLKQKVNKMEEKLDEADAYERRDTVILSGQDLPTATDGERSCDVVCSLVKKKLKLIFALPTFLLPTELDLSQGRKARTREI